MGADQVPAVVEEVELTADEEAALRPKATGLGDVGETGDPLRGLERYMRNRDKSRAKVFNAISTRITPFGRVRAAWAQVTVLPLLVPPKLKPLRGQRANDWRLELLVAPTLIPTPQRRRYMIANFGRKLCGIYRETPNPNNPLPCSVEGWWWHAGVFTSCELAAGITFNAGTTARLSETECRRWSIWLEAKAAGIELGAPE